MIFLSKSQVLVDVYVQEMCKSLCRELQLISSRHLLIFIFISCRTSRNWLLVSAQTGLHQEYIEELSKLDNSSFLLLDKCKSDGTNWSYLQRCHGPLTFDYPHILQVWYHLFGICFFKIQYKSGIRTKIFSTPNFCVSQTMKRSLKTLPDPSECIKHSE